MEAAQIATRGFRRRAETLEIRRFFEPPIAGEKGARGGRASALLGLCPPFIAKAFNVYFLRQQFLSLPTELEEAGVLDGASVWRQFWSLALPAVQPALVTVVLLDLLVHWSDFLWPHLIATVTDARAGIR